mmetsp:Transcript_12076/g.20964  ORF Transcript_12076/g.20964 Transcript_12076/m.20964 type:complete len:492 (-) Transcript_12076:491-1966(-)|eukprot:CAMPEP_0196655076 /NCGR_PEP_ID=MMETSP1086-20130531/4832_1 /TAXON_ID=77921 /ORGANISM="Cyanoptyche  gloeocystis , Strain SAG4.97" /LENGTH=491 /DNA_ID=CAMNT_0041987191 /DNA_START=166 /DNA_END=1641 /DNA_ORIENTATION=-
MRVGLLCAVIAFFCISWATSQESQTQYSPAIGELTDGDYEDQLQRHSVAVLLMYTPWCKLCVTVDRELAKAAVKVSADRGILIARINAAEHFEAAARFEVKEFPGVVIVSNYGKEHLEYGGKKTADAFLSHLHRLSPPISTVASKAQLQQFLEEETVFVAGFLLDATSDERRTFVAAVSDLSDETARYGIVTDPSLAEHYEITEPTVVVFSSTDGLVSMFPLRGASEAEVQQWIRGQLIPLVAELVAGVYSRYWRRGLTIALMLYDKANESHAQYLKHTAAQVAARHRGRVAFITADLIPGGHIGRRLGLQLTRSYGFAIQHPAGEKYPFPEHHDITVDALDKFVSGVLAGTVADWVMSAAVPEEQMVRDVRVVVGSTFRSIVLDASKDVFIEFYSPGCGRCKAFGPLWDAVAAKFKSVPTLLIAKLDGVENDTPRVNYDKFPTPMFFPANDKQHPIEYTGRWTIDALSEFIMQKASLPIDPSLLPEKEEL